MSEHLPRIEHAPAPGRTEKPRDSVESSAEQSVERDNGGLPDAEQLQRAVEAHARSRAEVTIHERAAAPSHSLGLHQELKSKAYQHSLSQVRRHLSPADRKLSRVIHQPTVEAVSQVAAGTIGRSSGLLGGALTGLIGSGYLLYMAKHYGYTYNFGVFVLCFAGGFLAGLAAEFVLRYVRRSEQ